MKLEQSFEVRAPLDEVWSALVDVQRVAPCLPGAEVTDAGEDGTYHGTFTVKIGPTTASYRGTLKMDSLDEAAREATMHATGTDKRGQGGAKAMIVSRLRQDGDVTHVDVETDFTITGRLARFGRGGMIEDVSNRLMRDFASCLQSSLASAEPEDREQRTENRDAEVAEAPPVAPVPAPAPPAPVQRREIHGIRLILGVLWERVVRFFRRLLGRGR